MKTIVKKSGLIIALLFSVMVVSAQKTAISKLFDKYENEDNITVINISKTMLDMMPSNMKTNNINIGEMMGKIDYLRIITSEDKKMKSKMYPEFKKLIDKNKNYEEIMSIKEKDSKITFNVQKKGDNINDFVMLINSEDDFVAIQILGNLTLDDIKKITEGANIQ